MVLTKKKKIIIGASVTVLLAIIVTVSLMSSGSDQIEVQTGKVEKKAALESKVTANGEVRPIQFINLTAEVSGRVTDIFVKEGEKVKKGQALLRVDPTQLASQASMQEAGLQAAQADMRNQEQAINVADNAVHTAKAALISSQADLERSHAELNNATIELRRQTDLREAGIVSKSAYDTAKMRYDSTNASVNAAKARVRQSEVAVRESELRVKQARTTVESSKARVNQARAGLAQQSDLLKKTTQYATIDGIIGGPIVQVGQFAVANLSSTGLLFIADMSEINVEVRVDETDITNVKVGQKAKVKVDALRDVDIEGEVIEKAAAAQTRTGQTIAQTAVAASQEAKDFKVVIRLPKLSEEVRDRLRPGMSATAVITTDKRDNVLTVPLAALVERDAPGADKNQGNKKPQKGVYIVENQKAVFKKVETGISGDNDIEIKSGLKAGEAIITGPNQQLRRMKDNQKVKLEDKNKKTSDGK